MAWRFRRSKKILPGVRANISKSGPSVTFGPRGMKATIGHGKIRRTVGIPGTGLYHTKTTSLSKKTSKKAAQSTGCVLMLLLLPFLVVQALLIQCSLPLQRAEPD